MDLETKGGEDSTGDLGPGSKNTRCKISHEGLNGEDLGAKTERVPGLGKLKDRNRMRVI